MLVIVALLAATLVVAACQEDPTEESVDTAVGSELDLDSAPCGNAYVDTVVVEETSDGEYVAVVTGNYPSSCDQLGKVEQSVDGNTITMTMCSVRPPGAVCAQQLIPFEETLPIDTAGLDAGTYAVDVNGATTTAMIE
jgi:hypothetical protein